MRGFLDVELPEFECNEGERPPLDALKKQRPLKQRIGERVLAMELEALGTSIHIPVPAKAQGKFVRVIVEVLT